MFRDYVRFLEEGYTEREAIALAAGKVDQAELLRESER